MMKACMGSYKDYPAMCRGFHAAATGKHAAGARPADVLVGSLTTLTYLMDVGEALGVPVWGVKVRAAHRHPSTCRRLVAAGDWPLTHASALGLQMQGDVPTRSVPSMTAASSYRFGWLNMLSHVVTTVRIMIGFSG